MAINIKVSDQYQGVVETAGSPQSSGVGEAITRVNSLSEIPANANGYYDFNGQLLSYVNGVSVGERNVMLSSSNTAAENTSIIQAALDLGGYIKFYSSAGSIINILPGLYYNSNSVVDFGMVRLKQVATSKDNLLVSAAYKATPIACTITGYVGKTCTISSTGHGLSVGNYISLKGNSTSQFNGTFRVSSVVDNNTFTVLLWIKPKGAASGTTTYVISTVNTTIIGLNLDYNYPNNIGVGTVQNAHHAVINAYIHNVHFENVKIDNVAKFAIWAFNYSKYSVDFMDCETLSDGHHTFGPALGGRFSNISGSFGDDCATISSRDITGIYVDISAGDVLDITHDNVTGKSTTAVVQMYTHAGYVADNIVYRGIQGEAPTTFNIWGDATDGGSLNKLTIADSVINNFNLDFYVTRVGGALYDAKHVTFDNCTFSSNRTGNDHPGFLRFGAAGVTTDRVSINNCSMIDSDFGNGATAYLLNVGQNSLGTYGAIKNIELIGNHIEGFGTAGFRMIHLTYSNGIEILTLTNNTIKRCEFVVGVGATNTDNTKITLTNNNISTVNDVFSLSGPCSVSHDKNRYASLATCVHLYNAAANVDLSETGNVYSGVTNKLTIGAGTITPRSLEISVDISKCNRVDGAICSNSNAALGTLGVAGPVICQGTAAGSWHLMSDPTKSY